MFDPRNEAEFDREDKKYPVDFIRNEAEEAGARWLGMIICPQPESLERNLWRVLKITKSTVAWVFGELFVLAISTGHHGWNLLHFETGVGLGVQHNGKAAFEHGMKVLSDVTKEKALAAIEKHPRVNSIDALCPKYRKIIEKARTA